MVQICSITLILALLITVSIAGVFADDTKVYIVYMGALPEHEYSPSAHHQSVLEQVLDNSVASESLVCSYGKSFNGFAARLTDSEFQKLAGIKGIVSVFPSKTKQLLTTRSWDFIGLRENVKRIQQIESDVVVGVIDSGIMPDSESFSDEGFGPPPKKWKGACDGGKNFTCNNKVIGARSYFSPSAIDTDGHGTHTASTAAGNQVKNVSFYGLGRGIARGAVPSARIAAYKVCGSNGCPEEALLASFDDAISDGVDIISISIGGEYAADFFSDSIAIGAFHAMQKGILTVQAAGNSGPHHSTVQSVAPWVLSVAASTIDRRFVDKVILGDGTTLVGTAVNGFDSNGVKLPMIYAGDAGTSDCPLDLARQCNDTCLDSTLVKGKIVFCDSDSKPKEPFFKKAAGAIVLQGVKQSDFSRVYPFPTSALNYSDSILLMSYINNTKKPEATILKSEELNDTSAPFVVSFSSRGPNTITPEILKPDVAAPGVDILAAYSPFGSPSNVDGDPRHVVYNIVSGTSMACPHVTGAAAYVKSFHPDWSPSAIQSALMTTAFPLDTIKNPDRELAYGAGHIDPVKAINPGLVYEAYESDYITMLCSVYPEDTVRLIVSNNTNCPKKSEGSAKDLNYPSVTSNSVSANITRTVTNFGAANSTYTATITSRPGLKVTVTPKVLSFKSLNEKKSFSVRVMVEEETVTTFLSASLVWSDGIHNVRSPITVYPEKL